MGGSNYSDLTDQQLVALCLERGDRDDRPLTELFNRHHRMVWRVCFRYLEDPDDAADLTQETFFRAYQNLATFEGRSSLKTWLYRIASNLCQNELRRRSRRPRLIERSVEDLEALVPEAPSLEQQSQRKLQRAKLSNAIGKLRPEELEMLLLRDFEGRSYSEIAQIQGVSLSAAKMRIHRARLALQRIYVQSAEDDPWE